MPGGYHEANHLSSRLHIFTTHFDLTTHSLNHRKSYRSLSTHVPPLPLPSSNCIMTFTHFTFTEIFFKNRSIHKYFLIALYSISLTVGTFYLYALILKNIWLKLLSVWLHWCFLIMHFLFFSWLNCWYRQKTHILCDLKLDLENILSRYRCLKMEVWTTGWLRKIRLTSLSW